MDLERITTVLRPRSRWESIDLGLSLFQANARVLFTAWAVAALPFLAIGFCVIALTNQAFIAFLLFWIPKPLYDRVMLHFLSRSLFGEQPGFWEIVREAPRAAFSAGAVAAITVLRFQPSRSFVLPVRMLEGVKGKVARERVSVLKREAGPSSYWLTVIAMHLVLGVNLAIILLVILFVPPEYVVQVTLWFVEDPGTLSNLLNFAAYVLAEAVIEPLYVTSGFSLYLNSRTVLEAWDIELMFKRLATRRAHAQRAAAAIALCICLGVSAGVAPRPAEAAVSTETEEPEPRAGDQYAAELRAEEIRAAIQDVLDDPDFGGRRVVEEWIRKKDDTETGDSLQSAVRPRTISRYLGMAFEWIMWTILGFGLVALGVWLVRHRERWLPYFRRAVPAARDAGASAPRLVHESLAQGLPADVSTAARELWRRGKAVEATSLLYRASVAALTRRFGVTIGDDATEGECLAAAGAVNEDVERYFVRVTRAWQQAAYAGQGPDSDTVESLCGSWSRHFEGPA